MRRASGTNSLRANLSAASSTARSSAERAKLRGVDIKGAYQCVGCGSRCHGARPSCGDEVSLGLREFNEGLPNCQALGRIRCRRSPEVPEIWRLRPWEAESVR